jgi:signal recognition particle GTPase
MEPNIPPSASSAFVIIETNRNIPPKKTIAMSLTAFIKGKFNPTPAQEQAFAALDQFFPSDRNVFLLKGYAGTGKTTLTKYLADYGREKKINPVLMAPTGPC